MSSDSNTDDDDGILAVVKAISISIAIFVIGGYVRGYVVYYRMKQSADQQQGFTTSLI